MEQRGAVSINELTEILGVSHMTIRRDVSKLEEQGLLVSVSGGVRAVSRLAAEPSHLVKSTLQSEEKQAIGALAASHIAKKTVASIWMPGLPPRGWRGRSSTGTISVWSPMIFEITQLLIDASQCGVIHTGGTLCRENRSCVGESAARTLRHPAIDTAFISASGWDSRGIFTPDENKVTVKETVSRSAREASCCATVRNTIRWPRLWRYL
uniref:Transcriptional regulator YgbI, DeoR family n=1 Tax=Klebsiella pneumoniae TaxID=573 RepID=A0A8B0SXK4_KLEPN|nr:Transcriptional regulator YgbI, DeoR family [Klebsiella pneumoniae]